MKLKLIFTTSILTLLILLPAGYFGLQKAEAQLSGLPGGGGGATPVRIVADTAETTIINTLKTALIEMSTALTTAEVTSMNMKETVLDPIAWGMAKQLQQQLTGNMLKWVGGQLPGQNGQVPFVQNYSEYYRDLADAVAGDFISGNRISGLCSPEADFKVKERVYYDYVQSRNEENGSIFQCADEDYEGPDGNERDRMFFSMLNCSDSVCAGFEAQYELAVSQANALSNEKQILDYSRGMIPQKVCRAAGGNSSSTVCELVNPPFLASGAVDFQLNQLPGLQMLQTDEFNEVVSNLMSNLTNQALTGLTGVLGLSGNPSYSANVFGEDGTLSYVDALLADDITKYQTNTKNPITEALRVGKEYREMLEEILDEIASLEEALEADTAEFAGCFDLELTDDLIEAQENASSSLSIASTSIAILTVLDTEYASSTSAAAKGAVMSAFMTYESQGLFRTQHENDQFRITFLEYTFAQLVDKFRYDIAVERQSCGGSFNYTGVLNPPPTAPPTGQNI